MLIIGGISVLFFADRFTDILDTFLVDTQYSNAVDNWERIGDDGMNPVRALVNSIPAILSVVGFRQIRNEQDRLINLSVNASIATAALSIIAVGTSGIYMGRLPIYVSMYSFGILLPWELKNIFSPDTSRIITVFAVVLYSIYFYYQIIC